MTVLVRGECSNGFWQRSVHEKLDEVGGRGGGGIGGGAGDGIVDGADKDEYKDDDQAGGEGDTAQQCQQVEEDHADGQAGGEEHEHQPAAGVGTAGEERIYKKYFSEEYPFEE